MSVRERPILLNDAMVRAILDGRKTQTRRPIKPQPRVTAHEEQFLPAAWAGGHINVQCPYGKPGDRLWVREAHVFTVGDGDQPDGNVVFRSDFRDLHGYHWSSVASDSADIRWRPSIHMPRWASRITLEVTDVRVERVQAISEEDATAEGVTPDAVRALWERASKARRLEAECDPDRPVVWLKPFGAKNATFDAALYVSPLRLWRIGWTLLYGAASWDANPWVWVVEFRRVEGEQ